MGVSGRRTLAMLVCALLAGGAAASWASASTTEADVEWLSSGPTDWLGTRVSVGNPDSGQRSVSLGDYLETSALAGASGFGDHYIQQGVRYEYEDSEGSGNSPCDLGSSSKVMYYFVEINDGGTKSCYAESLAATAESHLQEVMQGASGNWRPYLDGVWQGHETAWSGCGGNACWLAAFAESDKSKVGSWYAKYAGSGNTRWQQYNGTLWSTISNYTNSVTDEYWTGPSGPFPDGIWSFEYSH